MKLSKSKLALAKVINENGGWPSDEANFAAQDKIDGESNDNTISFYSGKVKPARLANNSMWRCENSGSHFMGHEKTIRRCKLLANWHQTCLSREEYYQAYPKAEADGWIEWSADGKTDGPIGHDVHVDVKLRCGSEHLCQFLSSDSWMDLWGDESIVAYRLHKPEVKSDPRKSVTRSIPDPEEKFSDSTSIPRINQCRCKVVDIKPTIEQLAQYYRNAKDCAERLQEEADEAAKVAYAKLVELERAGEELGLLIAVAKPNPELSITDWRDLKVGDVVFVDEMRRKSEWSSAMVGRECMVIEDGENYPVCFVNDFTPDGESYWIGGVDDGDITWRFIRRP